MTVNALPCAAPASVAPVRFSQGATAHGGCKRMVDEGLRGKINARHCEPSGLAFGEPTGELREAISATRQEIASARCARLAMTPRLDSVAGTPAPEVAAFLAH